jgi:hypothetical protein
VRIALTVASLSFVCACNAPKSKTEATWWTTVDGSKGDVHEAVAAEARVAMDRGLVPVLYLSATYTAASTRLLRLRDTPPMRDALAGIAVIEVDPRLGYEELLRGNRHSFHALDRGGNPTGPELDPGTKDGPCADGDAISCAAWIRPFARSLCLHRATTDARPQGASGWEARPVGRVVTMAWRTGPRGAID